MNLFFKLLLYEAKEELFVVIVTDFALCIIMYKYSYLIFLNHIFEFASFNLRISSGEKRPLYSETRKRDV